MYRVQTFALRHDPHMPVTKVPAAAAAHAAAETFTALEQRRHQIQKEGVALAILDVLAKIPGAVWKDSRQMAHSERQCAGSAKVPAQSLLHRPLTGGCDGEAGAGEQHPTDRRFGWPAVRG